MLRGYDYVFLRRASVNPFGGSFTALADYDVVIEVLRRRFDVLWVHGYNFLTHVMAVMTQRGRGGRVMFREVQTLMHPRPLGRTLIKEAGLRFLFGNGPAMYMGAESRRWFEHYGVPPDRLVFAPHAVDNDGLRAAAQRLAPMRRQLLESFGLDPGNGPVILTVSRLIPEKAPEVLLEAFARVRRELPCSLLIVGAGTMLEPLRERVRAENIPDVVFAGFLNQTEVPKAYACADIFALVSRRNETWGLVVNEAMNFGLPVVVSDKVGCGADLVRHGFSGFVVDSDDAVSLAARLTELVRDENKRATLGAAGKTIVEAWNHRAAAAGVLRAVELAVGPERWQSATMAAEIQP